MFARIIMALALLLSLSPARSIGAEIKEFDKFTLDIPPNWSAEQNEGGVYITVNDGSAIVSILSGTFDEGTSLSKAAANLAQRLRGDTPRDHGNGQAFSFTYIDPNTGHQAVSLVTAVGAMFVYITQIGENEEADHIIRSIKPRATSGNP